jgi:uncharacterized membrane protein
MDTRRRSLAKAITWRLVATVVTALVALAVTRSTSVMVKVGIADMILKLIIFYYHERLWLIIPFGKTRDPEYHI